MKKLLFGLGILPLAVLPILTIASCGTSSIGDDDTTSPGTTTDLKITATPSTQSDIDKAITNFNKNGAADPAKIAALKTIFKGVTPENFKNFDVKATPTAGTIPGTVVLKAKPGFSFGISLSLTSSLAKMVDLQITAIPSIQQTIDKAITDFNTTGATEAAKITALSTIFKGITTTNFKNFVVKATPTSTDGKPGTIILTAKSGFNFGSTSSLTSVLLIDLKITPIKIAQPIIDKSIEDFNVAKTDAARIEALKTTFDGIKLENFKNFEVIATAGTPGTSGPSGTILLTAKEGFIFGTSKILSSKVLGTNLDEQVDKFSTPVETKTKTTLATEAVKSINDARDAAAKLAALEVLATLPTLSTGFTFAVESAIVNTKLDTWIDVKIVVTETATSTTKSTIFRVTGLKGAPTLDEEAAKFATPVETKTPDTLATEAIKLINVGDAAAKLAALEVLATLPTLSAGFTFEVKSAIVNTTTPTSIDVTITVTQQATSTTKDTIFVVTGLKATPTSTLDEEAGKFIPKGTKTPDILATAAAKTIVDATTSTEKLDALKVLVDLPTLSDGFYFMVTSAKVNTVTPTSIDVSIVVTEKATDTTKDIIFTVTGLKETPGPKPTLQEQADLFNKTFTAKNTEQLVAAAIKSINDAIGVEAKTTALEDLATLPTLSPEFTFVFKSVAPTSGTNTSIDVTITITEKATSKNLDKFFTITGFKEPAIGPTLDEEAGKFQKPVETKDKTILATEAAKSINDGTNSKDRLNALKNLADLPPLSAGFAFIVNSAKVNTTMDTSIDVSITVLKEATRTRKDISFTVIGLKGAPNLDREAAKFLTPVVTTKPEMSATEAANSINTGNADAKLAALKNLAVVPTLSKGFTFEVKSAIVSTSINTSIDVSITILQEAPSNVRNVTFTITGLKTADKSLIITATPTTQAKINEAITAYKAAAKDPVKELAALNIIFDGTDLIEANLANFTVLATETVAGTPGTIVLTAKDGYAFGESKTLSSTLIINLNIVAIPSTQSVIDKAIANLAIALNPTEEQKIEALSTVFTGITPENFKNINRISAIPGNEGKPGTITIRGKKGVTFSNGEPQLTSILADIVDLKIKVKPSTKEQIDQAIRDYTYAGNDVQKIAALSMLFEGIDSVAFANLNIQITLSTPDKLGKITLTPKEGYTINGLTSLSSELAPPTLDEEVAKFKPTKTSTPSTTTTNAIKSITEATGAGAKLVELQKLAIVPTPSDGFTFEVNSAKLNVENPTSIDVTITITEKAGTAGSNTKEVIFTITGLTGDLIITPTPSTQTTIDQAIANFNAPGATNANKASALQSVFAGITIENFKNFDAVATAGSESVAGTIVLTAKSGFAINGQTTLSSVALTNLIITAKSSTQTVINKAISDINANTATLQQKVAALSTVFEGITIDNFANFGVDVTTTPGTIVLTANTGFVINGQETLSSWAIVDLNITAKISTKEQIDQASWDYTRAQNDNQIITALSMLFEGINLDVLAKLEKPEIIWGNSTTPGKITLTAKEGYTIKERKTLSSELAPPTLDEEVAKFKPTKTLTPSTTTTNAIKSITDVNTPEEKLAALKVLATLPTLSNEFTFEVKSAIVNTTTPTSIDVSITVTETAGTAGSNTKEVIFTITGLTGDLIITPTPSTQATVDQVINVINSTNVSEAAKTLALQSVFGGITIENFKNFEVDVKTTPGTIDLTAKPGFVINGQATLSSVLFIDLKITAIPQPSTAIMTAIEAYNAATTDTARITALSTVFDGITPDNFKNFAVDVKIMPGTIVLKANYGYTINGKETLASHSHDATDLKITVAEGKIISQKTIDDAIIAINADKATPETKITALLTIFDGVTMNNFDLFTITATATVEPIPGKVVLTAEPGFSFGLAKTLTSMIVESLEGQPSQISAKRVAQTIINDAITAINAPGATKEQKIVALSTVFDHITSDNFEKFTIEAKQAVGTEFGTIVLTAKPGFIFGTSKTLSSIINLPITAKPVGQQVIEDAITAINAPGATKEQKIVALSKVFDGITTDNFENINIFIEGSTDYHTFLLTAKTGFAFDGELSIRSEALPATYPPTIEHKNNIK